MNAMNELSRSNAGEQQPSQRQQQQQRAREEAAIMPPVDVVEDASGITLYADLPGVSRETLNLRVEADTLTIEGDMALQVPDGMQPSHAEVQIPRYRRIFTLSKELDPDKVSAELRNGVLKLRIPKAEHAQPRKVEIRVR
jgi:HSP20 family molecular chaperone IbpA